MITDADVNTLVYCLDGRTGRIHKGALAQIFHHLGFTTALVLHPEPVNWPTELLFTTEKQAKQAKEALDNGTQLVPVDRLPFTVPRRQPVLRDDQRSAPPPGPARGG